jgi:hypothetical protein
MSCAPDQLPEAKHALASLLVQTSVAALPEVTVLGVAPMVTVGVGRVTVTVADCVAEPPGPVQVSPNSVVSCSAPVDEVPLVATAPFQPPLAVHAVAAVAVHVRADSPR